MKHSAMIIALAAIAWTQSPGRASAQEFADPVQPAAATFQVVPLGQNSAIMVDLRTGQSWKLERDPDNEPGYVWAPVRRLSTNMQVDEWREKMKKFRAERRKRRTAGLEPIPELPPEPDFDLDPVLRAPIPPWDTETTM